MVATMTLTTVGGSRVVLSRCEDKLRDFCLHDAYRPYDRIATAGLTHHNSEAGLYGKFRIPNKLKLLPYSLATFR
jgi:hypothetical protein